MLSSTGRKWQLQISVGCTSCSITDGSVYLLIRQTAQCIYYTYIVSQYRRYLGITEDYLHGSQTIQAGNS